MTEQNLTTMSSLEVQHKVEQFLYMQASALDDRNWETWLSLFTENGKMGFGALRYLSNPIVAVIDSENGGKNISEITLISRDVPVVSNIDVAIENGAEVLLLGIANSGGQIPKSWFPIINLAIEKGLSIINGLHNLLALKYSKKIKKEQKK